MLPAARSTCWDTPRPPWPHFVQRTYPSGNFHRDLRASGAPAVVGAWPAVIYALRATGRAPSFFLVDAGRCVGCVGRAGTFFQWVLGAVAGGLQPSCGYPIANLRPTL